MHQILFPLRARFACRMVVYSLLAFSIETSSPPDRHACLSSPLPCMLPLTRHVLPPPFTANPRQSPSHLYRIALTNAHSPSLCSLSMTPDTVPSRAPLIEPMDHEHALSVRGHAWEAHAKRNADHHGIRTHGRIPWPIFGSSPQIIQLSRVL